MAPRFDDTFGTRKICIGVVHLLSLPGSPDFAGDLTRVIERAANEATLIAKAGFDGLIVENYGDMPFLKEGVDPETVAAMAIVAREIKGTVDIPVGVNVLRNDYRAGLAIAAACGCEFVRVNILVGAFLTPEGLIEGKPGEVLRIRQRTAPNTMIFADVMVKHAYPLAATTIGDDALDAADRGRADCIIVTGTRTGRPPSGEDLKVVRARLEEAGMEIPVVVGSGITGSNAEDFLRLSDGLIVGSYIRKDGRAGEQLELEKALQISEIKRKVEA